MEVRLIAGVFYWTQLGVPCHGYAYTSLHFSQIASLSLMIEITLLLYKL